MALILYPNDNYDAFITVADCDTFLTNNVPSSQRVEYDAIVDDADKEILIRQATTLIKTKITLPSTLEQNLQEATAYLVNHSTTNVMTSDNGNGNLKVKDITGVIKKEYFSQAESSDSFPNIVESLLSEYGIVQDGSFVMVRA